MFVGSKDIKDRDLKVWLTEDLETKLIERAQRLRMTKSELVRAYIQRAIARSIHDDITELFDVA